MSEALIQAAILRRLQDFAPLVALLSDSGPGITDYVPQNITPENDVPFPFVTIGDDEHDQWDTDTTAGFDSDLRVHCWTRRRGRLQAKEIQAQIYAALHNHDLFIGGGMESILLQWMTSNVQPDPDGKTHHGVQSFHLLSDQAP